MNPNYLSKDELIYELRLRGINSDEEVQWLRKLFGSVVAREVPPEARRLEGCNVDELYTSVVRKIYELQELVDRPEASIPVLVNRVRTRLLHLRGRVLHLEERLEPGLKFGSTDLRNLLERLEGIEKSVAMAEASERRVRDLGSETDRETVSKVDEGAEETSVNAAQGATLRTTPRGSREPEFLSHMYQKLPHPLTHLLKELPQVDDCSVDAPCEFLLKVIHLRQVSNVKDPAIYKILYPHCKGEVLVLLRQALAKEKRF